MIDCADGKPCPEGWYCPATGENVCVLGSPNGDGTAEDAGIRTPDAGPRDAGGGDTGGPDDGGGADVAGPDGGAGDAGAEDGGDAGPCGDGCMSPPDNVCIDARTLKVYETPGTCGGAGCVYASHTQSCPYGCGNGRCVNCTPDCGGKECGDNGCGEPCGQCDKPPSSYCLDGSRLRSYSPVGACAAGACAYSYSDISCQYGCAGAQCKSCARACGGKECGGDGCGGSCGSCGSNQTCSGGSCVCTGGYDDCDGDPHNGCEANLASDPGNCTRCGRVCPADAECARAVCQGGGCGTVAMNEGATCGGQGECRVCRGGSCACNTPHYECPSCLPSCGVLGGNCCPSTMSCDASGEKGTSHDCFRCCAGQCI